MSLDWLDNIKDLVISISGGAFVGLSMLFQVALRDGLSGLRNAPPHRARYWSGVMLRLLAVCMSFALLILVVHFISPKTDPSVVNIVAMVIGLIATLWLGQKAAKRMALAIQRALRRLVTPEGP